MADQVLMNAFSETCETTLDSGETYKAMNLVENIKFHNIVALIAGYRLSLVWKKSSLAFGNAADAN